MGFSILFGIVALGGFILYPSFWPIVIIIIVIIAMGIKEKTKKIKMHLKGKIGYGFFILLLVAGSILNFFDIDIVIPKKYGYIYTLVFFSLMFTSFWLVFDGEATRDQEEKKIIEEARKQEEEREKAEEKRRAEEARKQEKKERAEEARRQEERKRAEEARKQEERKKQKEYQEKTYQNERKRKDKSSIYKTLGIDTSATNQDIKKAYRKMANHYHPDKVSHLGEEFQLLAEKKFKAINEAYEKIRIERGLK